MTSDSNIQKFSAKPGRKIFKFFRIALLFGVLIGLMLLLFYYLENRSEEKTPGSAPITVSVMELKSGSLASRFEFIGEIKAKQLAMVSPEINMVRILEISAEVGQVVKKGDLLAILDNASLSFQRDQAKSAYAQIQDEYSRKSRLGINGGISQEELTIKRLAVESAKAKWDDAELLLSKSQLFSPVDGIIISRNQDIGSLSNMSSPLFSIAVNSATEFVASIPENQLALFTVGQSVRVTLSGYPTEIEGIIDRIEPQINNISRTANVFIRFEEHLFHPIGLFGTARITLPEQTGLLVPSTAILFDELGRFVWYVDTNNRIYKNYVREILREGDRALIELLKKDSSPLESQAISQRKILVRAGSLVNEGDLVTPLLQTQADKTPKTVSTNQTAAEENI